MSLNGLFSAQNAPKRGRLGIMTLPKSHVEEAPISIPLPSVPRTDPSFLF